MTRRHLLMGTGYFGALGASLLLSGPFLREPQERTVDIARAEPPPVLRGDGYSITTEGKGVSILLSDAEGRPVQRFPGYRLGTIEVWAGTASIGLSRDGVRALIVDYDVPGAPDGTSIRGTFAPDGRVLDIVFDIVAPGSASARSGMLRREPVGSGWARETADGIAGWTRDPRGGIPYQSDARLVYRQRIDDTTLAIITDTGYTQWRDGRRLHVPGQAASEGSFRAHARVIVGAEARPTMLEAQAAERPLAVELSTDRPFNLWESADEPLVVRGAVWNGGVARRLTLTWTARDFDGAVLAERTRRVDADASSVVEDELPVTLPGRGIAFVELTASASGDTAYSRTNVAVLPPHEFTDTAEKSMFGLAAAYLLGTEEERKLIKRIGVRHVRPAHFDASQLSTYGFTQHRVVSPADPGAYEGDSAGLARHARLEFDTAEKLNATHYECANEWNMKGEGLLSGDGAATYVKKWLRAFSRELRRRDSDMGLLPVALAGMDDVYARAMYDAGLTKYTKAFNLHPGRGNVTPDYVPKSGTYWNFLGSVRAARRMMRDHGNADGELWLTEVYAPTRPNAWRDDTYRHAAENVVLTAALALAEDVTAMLWFQLHDNVKTHPHGASPGNREFHHGLLLRDRSPKPSLLAFANIAEQLDGARFARWLSFADAPDRRGMHFHTPRGPLVMLWNRADGHTLNASPTRDGSFFAAPEPWVDTWDTKEKVRLPAARENVVEIDAIGRRRTIRAEDSTATVTLDGAARLYYGLDMERLRAKRD
ncbi:hypothetical protein [Microbacterium rhizophilus]|uniref:hypothetical protein n=1 Tax=Microbacterium rhizophilus TaxID=3138934 RepID=UPI0031EC5287